MHGKVTPPKSFLKDFFMNPQKIIFIVGPTAVGKSQIALTLAKEINAEIISCDAMQVYREITIASNKPAPQALKEIPHHLVGIQSIEEEFNAAEFYSLASEKIHDIFRRGKTPLIVGGSGMYMQVLLDGIFKDGIKDETVRQNLKKQIEEEGLASLYRHLEKIDPEAALKIHPNDEKRIIRALEVFHVGKKKISQAQKDRQGLWGKHTICLFCCNRPREELYQKINERVEEMFQKGLVEEIRRCSTLGLSKTARQIIGVKEVSGYLHQEYDLEEAKHLMKLHTRHYAKRQLTWFRREKRLAWLEIGSNDIVEGIVEKILTRISQQ